jgi:hypothetical protein
VPAAIVLHNLPPEHVLGLAVPGPEDGVVPVPGAADGDGRLTLDTPRYERLREPVLQLRVATDLHPATAALTLTVRGAGGRPLARCRVLPSAYADNTLVSCPVARSDEVRSVVLGAHGGSDPLYVYARTRPGRPPLAGTLQETTFGGGTVDQVREAWARLGVTRPGPFGPALLLVGLGGSLLALAGGLWLALRPATGSDERVS